MKSVLAWHFLPENKMLRYGDLRKVIIGQKLSVDAAQLVPCQYGLHASLKAMDALTYAPGPIICRVELSGRILEHGDDKLCASERTVIWMADASRTLDLFAAWVAEQELLLDQESGREPDGDSWAAIQAKRAWIDGNISVEELKAAKLAAKAASAKRGATWAAQAAWVAAGPVPTEAAAQAVAAAANLTWGVPREKYSIELTARLRNLPGASNE